MTRLPEEPRAAAGGGGRQSGGGTDPGDSGRSDDATASNALSSSSRPPLNMNHRRQLHLVTSALLSNVEYNPAVIPPPVYASNNYSNCMSSLKLCKLRQNI